MSPRVHLLLLNMLLATAAVVAEEPLLYAGFDGSPHAVLNLAESSEITGFANLSGPYVEGIKGQARVLGGRNRLTYRLNEGFFPPEGSCTLWVQPQDWQPTATDKFVFFATFTYADVQREYVRAVLYRYYNRGELAALVQNTVEGKTQSLIRAPIDLWRQGQWHHLAMTWDQDTLLLYIDGEVVGKSPMTPLPAQGRWEIAVGTPYQGWLHLGKETNAIDEFAVWGRMLVPEEIRRQYEAGTQRAKQLSQTPKDTREPIRGNLALARDGAYALASSFADYEKLYTDNLVDGRDDTSWRPHLSSLPQWVEVRWETPIRATEVTLRQKTPGAIQTFDLYAWVEDDWRLLRQVSADDQAGPADLSASFDELSTDRLRATIRKADITKLELTTFAVTGPGQPIIARLKPYWHASYIWYPEPDELHKGNAPRYFRKTFEVRDADALRSAVIQLRSNDFYKAYINGTQVATGAKIIKPADVTGLIRPGKNVIAVVADLKYNPGRWGWGQLIFELSLNYDAHSEFVVSDATCRTHDAEAEGWLSGGFDDSGWLSAAQFTRPPDGVWGAIEYHSSTVNERAHVRSVSISPTEPKPGQQAQVRVTLRADQALRDDYAFLLEIGDEERFPEWSDLSIASAVLQPQAETSTWEPGQDNHLVFDVYVPRYAPGGRTRVAVTGYGTRHGAGLDLLDADGKRLEALATLTIDRSDPEPEAIDGAALVSAQGSLALRVGGRTIAPEAWAYTHPSFDRFHEYTQTGVRLHHLKAHPLSWDGTTENLQETCEHLDRRLSQSLRVDPGAMFIIQLDLRPTGEWLKEHPQERLVTAGGNLGPVSYSSKAYNEGVLGFVGEVIHYLKGRPYYDRIVGYLPMSCGQPDSAMGGVDENLFQTDRTQLTIGDYNPQAIDEFRGRLRHRYGEDVAALQAAWRDPDVTFDTATPQVAQLTAEGAEGGVFRDPADGAMTFDYAEWLSGVMGRFYSRVMRLIKQQAGRQVLVGTYYGYNVAHLRGYNTPGTCLQNNNLDLPAMLRNPDWDFFAAPAPYSARRAGCPYYTSFTYDSLRLHKKLLISELDHRTFVAGPTTYGRLRSDVETAGVLKRDMLGPIIDGAGFWFADWSRGSGRGAVGFFMDPDILQAVEATRTVHEQALSRPKRSTSQIAVFTSGPTMAYHDVYRAAPIYDNLIVHTLWNGMGKLGAPYDIYSLSDLGEPAVQDGYKLYVFLNAFFLTPEDRARIEVLKRDGKTLLFLYAPGYVSREEGLSLQALQDVVGMSVTSKPGIERMEYRMADTGLPAFEGLSTEKVYRTSAFSYDLSVKLHPPEFGPVFAIDDPEATPLATYPDGKVALAAKHHEGWRSVYCVVPRMDSEVLRAVARYAGVHLYCTEDVVMKADNRLVVLHNAEGPSRTLEVHLPTASDVVDAYSGEVIARDSDTFTVSLRSAETRALRLQ